MNNESGIDLKQTSIEDKLQFIGEKKLAHLGSYVNECFEHKMESRNEDKSGEKEMVRGKDMGHTELRCEGYTRFGNPMIMRSADAFDLENPTSKISDLIKFFKNDVEKGDQIYAHKEFEVDAQTG